MKKTHKEFFRKLHELCGKHSVVINNANIRFLEDMPGTDEMTGHYNLISMHPPGGMHFKTEPLIDPVEDEDDFDEMFFE